MSMSMSIKAFNTNQGEKYEKHKQILLFCAKMKVSLPIETSDYFNCKYPDLDLLEKNIEVRLVESEHYEQFSEDMEQGYYVNLNNLPKNATTLRFSIGF